MISLKKEFDNNKTYFESNFQTAKIPTIFIHGVGLDNSMWIPQKTFFSNQSVIFYDILNHGKSQKGFSELSFQKFSKQLDDLVNYLNVKNINLVGFSIGALIAQHYTVKNYKKVNKLVLIGSVYKRTEEQIKTVKNRFKNALNGESITIDSIKRWFTGPYLKDNPNVFNFFFKLLEKKENSDFLPAYKVFVESDSEKIDFSNFTMPTLIMTGEHDIGSTPKMSEDLHREIKNSSLCIIKNAKHGVTMEKSEKVNKQILNFLF